MHLRFWIGAAMIGVPMIAAVVALLRKIIIENGMVPLHDWIQAALIIAAAGGYVLLALWLMRPNP